MRWPVGALRALQTRLILVFTAIPFALLANSWQVHMNLRIYNDGSAHRSITAAASPYFASAGLEKWLNDVESGGKWDYTWREQTPQSFRFTRDMRLVSVDDPRNTDRLLTIADVASNPLSLYTTYTWRENLKYLYHSGTDPTVAGAAEKELVYRVEMPGAVTGASIDGGGSAEPGPGYATFKIPADKADHTIEVTSRRVRWGYLLLVAYPLAWIGHKVSRALARAASRRPRKI